MNRLNVLKQKYCATCLARMMGVTVAVALLALAGTAAGGNALILNVPDWDQPDDYAGVTLGLIAGDAPNWCSPTAGANLMGYWEDQKGYNGLTDGLAWAGVPNTPPFPNPANGMWQQNNWHDCTIEMGFFMDSGSWATAGQNGNGVWPPALGWTGFGSIGPGAATFAAWRGYANIPFSKDSWPGPGWTAAQAQAMWTKYVGEIDAGLPVLCSFDCWAGAFQQTVVVNGQNVDKYLFTGLTSPHTVVGVGYLDANPAALGDEWFIAQDNKTFTGQYVAVPLSWNTTEWRQNDYVAIPEPATLSLLAIGAVVLIRRRAKRR